MKAGILVNTLVLLSMFIAPSGMAHHSVSFEFDATKQITREDRITRVIFRNPHVHFYMMVNENGKEVEWNVQGHTLGSLRKMNWNQDTVEVGDVVSFTGMPSHRGSKKLRLHYVTLADGSTRGEARRLRTKLLDNDSAENLSIVASTREKLHGDWAFSTEKRLPGGPLHLQFINKKNGFSAILDGNEIRVGADEENLSFILDREDAGGFAFRLVLKGKLDGDQISGRIEIVGTKASRGIASTWKAVRTDAESWKPKSKQKSNGIDLTGTWRRTIGVGPIGRNEPVELAPVFRTTQFSPTVRVSNSTGLT